MLNIKRIKKQSWYRQESESNPYFIYRACRACVQWFKNTNSAIWCSQPDHTRAWLNKELLRTMSEYYLKKEKVKTGHCLSLFKKWSKEVKQKNLVLFKKIDKLKLEKISNAKLLELNKQLVQRSYTTWLQFFIDIFDVDAESFVELDLVNSGISLSDDEKNIMMSPLDLIVYKQEERDLLKIVKVIKNTPGAVNSILYINTSANLHRLKLYPFIRRLLVNHQKKYFWIQNSWALTHTIDIFSFVENIKQILISKRNIIEEIKSLDGYSRSIKKSKEKIANKYKMPKELKQTFNFFSLLAYWRDERKAQVQQLNHYLELLGTAIAERSGLTWHDIKICDPFSLDKIPVTKDLIKKYQRFFSEQYVIIWDGHKVVNLNKRNSALVYDTIEQTIENEFTEIRGMIACPGKVKGRAVIIKKESDFSKMRSGSIIVTPMTRPDFLPFIKKAAAIVTDEGGITSHAAIVSREFKIPCVIGTQIASRKLKDGDLIEVNANHGVIRVL